MNGPATEQVLRERLGERLRGFRQHSPRRFYAEVAPESVPEVTRLLFRELGLRLQTVTGTDGGDHMELLYHWANDGEGYVLSIRTRIDREKPEIASVAEICKGAEWIEREIWELLGVNFTGHPDLRHLLLRDDWPEGACPLRRDYRKGEGDG
ncbi:MAG TPA: NADH-quinone oxidoreductase subunit C [Lentisphaerae bacterium]|nr:NADH-quinone oxidoreductase subunit C [Lentisphaerota bacterium]